MSDIAIRVENIGKQFRIGHAEGSYKTLRDTITDAIGAPFRKAAGLLKGQTAATAESNHTIWALNNVSFEVKPGEIMGIIGRNGAGKSTLLKILSRITEPTQGFAEIRGRVGSLLEVGTGFHGELSGRENIYLNAAILGMSRSEIKQKFDEMVSFAEVEKFIDTPVKHYSSGMYLRLAFAVASSLEPEILIVDEVLAVGDARFQKKCLNKMEDIGQKGRTVLFVSHSMPAITRLCKRAILLQDGTVKADGLSSQVVNTYINNGIGTSAVREWTDRSKSPGSDIVRLSGIRVITEDGKITDSVDVSQTFGIEMEYEVRKSGHFLMPYHHIFNEGNIEIFQAHDTDAEWRGKPRPAGRYTSTVWIHGNLLSEGMLYVSSGITRTDVAQGQFYEKDAVTLQVVENLENESSARGDWSGDMGGVVRPFFKWSTQCRPCQDGLEASKAGKYV